MKLAVVGARGQLGGAIVRECAPAHDVIALGRADLDITDDEAVADTMSRIRPDAIVNCAAYTHVDAAEDHPIDALNGNAFAVRALARAADGLGAALVHYSTDFVFDGQASAPYRESDPPGPRSVYAVSKLLGEWFAQDAPRAYVLRVESLFGGALGFESKGSVAGILKTMRAGGSPAVFEDRTISPTYVADGAKATRHLLESGAASGLYHCVNSGSCTWVELAAQLALELDVRVALKPVRMADMSLRAQRPLYCVLSNDKLRSAGFEMPTWQDAIRRFVRNEVLTA